MSEDGRRRHRNALEPGTLLGDYVVVSARAEGRGNSDELGSGGFGIVYLARHRGRSDWLFAIKEYFPQEVAVRDRQNGESVWPSTGGAETAFEEGLERFRREADQLHRLKNEHHVVSCVNYFEANGTAYLVMQYDDGVPLSKYLRLRESKGRPFDEYDLLAVALPLLKGLSAVHRVGVLHRDIKPGNVFVRREDDQAGRPAEPVLMDFGAAKQEYLGRCSRGSAAPYTPGYAAWEQVSRSGTLSHATDLYGVGAVLWRMVAGGTGGHPDLLRASARDGAGGSAEVWIAEPPDVLKRVDAMYSGLADPMPPAMELGSGRFSAPVLQAIDRCLAIQATERPQSCEELATLLRWHVVPNPPRPHPEPPRPPGQNWRRLVLVAGGAVGLLAGRRAVAFLALGAAGLLAAALIFAGVFGGDRHEGFSPEDQALSPPSEVQRLLAAAAVDLEGQRLTHPEGNNAWQKYQRVLELSPGLTEALIGLEKVLAAFVSLSDAAMDQGQLDEASEYLERVRELNPDFELLNAADRRLDAVRKDVRDRLDRERERENARRQNAIGVPGKSSTVPAAIRGCRPDHVH